MSEPKKLALFRMAEILHDNTDEKHPMTQAEMIEILKNRYGIELDRKAIGRNFSRLKELGMEISSSRKGSWLNRVESNFTGYDFDDSELHVLIDGVINSRYISKRHSKDLIDKLSKLSNKYFKSGHKYVHSLLDTIKTDNQSLFFNVELIDEAIRTGKKIQYDFNKYGIDKKLYKTATHIVSPCCLLVHNQRYYLVLIHDKWQDISFHRVDHLTNMQILKDKAQSITTIKGYERGLDYKAIVSRPYLFNDAPVSIEMIIERWLVDDVVDWFGDDVRMSELPDGKVRVVLRTSPMGMKFWALQYMESAEIVSPKELRESIIDAISGAKEKYDV